MIKYSDHYCESIPWRCDCGTNIYEVKICSAKDMNFYVFAKQSTFLGEVRHGSTDTGMIPKPDPERIGETTILFYIKNKNNNSLNSLICYRDCHITGDLGSIKFLLNEKDIDEEAFIVGDTYEEEKEDEDEDKDEDKDKDKDNSDKHNRSIQDVIGALHINDFINTYVNDPMLCKIILEKFQNNTWKKPFHITPQVTYNPYYEKVGRDEWYQLFLQDHLSQYNPFGISHLRISLFEHLGTWFLPSQNCGDGFCSIEVAKYDDIMWDQHTRSPTVEHVAYKETPEEPSAIFHFLDF